MFVFDSLPDDLTLLERREVKRLLLASVGNKSKAAQALREEILSGSLSAKDVLHKARMLNGITDEEESEQENKTVEQSKYPIAMRRYSIEELSNPQTYADDSALPAIARSLVNARFTELFAGKMGRGDAKRSVMNGQYPELIAAEIEKEISRQEEEYIANQKGIEAAMALSVKGYELEIDGDEILIRGKFDNDLHQRIKRIGYWDGESYGGKNRKCWVIPAHKGKSLKTIFKNHLVSKDAADKERQKAAAEAYERARQKEIDRRNAEIEQRRKESIAKSKRVKVEVGQYSIGDEINGMKIASFGTSWTEGGDYWVQVTDENSSAYGYQPGLDYYPKVKVSSPEIKYQYAYPEVD